MPTYLQRAMSSFLFRSSFNFSFCSLDACKCNVFAVQGTKDNAGMGTGSTKNAEVSVVRVVAIPLVMWPEGWRFALAASAIAGRQEVSLCTA